MLVDVVFAAVGLEQFLTLTTKEILTVLMSLNKILSNTVGMILILLFEVNYCICMRFLLVARYMTGVCEI